MQNNHRYLYYNIYCNKVKISFGFLTQLLFF